MAVAVQRAPAALALGASSPGPTPGTQHRRAQGRARPLIASVPPSRDRGLRPGEAPRGLQLQVPVLPQALGKAGEENRRDPQVGAEVWLAPWRGDGDAVEAPLIFIPVQHTGARRGMGT